jgi:medium-chain acyl-[acyl-carrier-protein] hydrolase
MSADSLLWFERYPARGPTLARLFCIPHAGGSGYAYRDWIPHLPQWLELIGVRLPGRGARVREPAFHRMEPLISALGAAILQHLDKPFALFGHSMGALVAFELSMRLAPRGLLPFHLFVSGTRPPHFSRDEKQLHRLPRESFLEELRKLNGTALEILEDDTVMSSLLPVLRADFELVETYPARARPAVYCPITALGGREDETVSEQELQEWSHYTRLAFRCHMFPGDHFFIGPQEVEMLSLISTTIRNAYPPQPNSRHQV